MLVAIVTEHIQVVWGVGVGKENVSESTRGVNVCPYIKK